MVKEAIRSIRESGREAIADAATRELSGIELKTLPTSIELASAVDLLLVFGGDGTMLRVAREVAGHNTPIVGINAGGLGFLTAIPSTQMEPTLARIWKGHYFLEKKASDCRQPRG